MTFDLGSRSNLKNAIFANILQAVRDKDFILVQRLRRIFERIVQIMIKVPNLVEDKFRPYLNMKGRAPLKMTILTGVDPVLNVGYA